MKYGRILFFISSVVLSGILWQGCNKAEDLRTGSIDFGMNPSAEEALKSLSTQQYDVYAALVTIVGKDGETIYEKEYIEFYSWGESFVTKSLKLNVGDYRLTEFLLIDSSGNVTWATPLEGSRLAGLVEDPLPMHFSIYENSTTHLYPQVVRVGSSNPEDFGYVNFNVQFVEGFCMKVFYETICDYWFNNDSILGPADNGFAAPYFPATMLIYAGDDMIAEEYLIPGANKVPVPKGYEKYRLVVYDCGFQMCFDEEFTITELKHFACREGDYLKIGCIPDLPEVVVTPEDITEPTIDQGVFGQITNQGWDSVDIVGDFAPDMYRLFIYERTDGDTIFYPEINSCMVQPDLNLSPLAIVQTNTSGYYQLPLEPGEYAYMVDTWFGFYVDLYISSHVPGFFEVEEGKVSILNIYVTPCIWY